MKTSSYLIPIFWFVVGFILCLLLFQGCRKEVLEYWEVDGFKTDTITVTETITLRELVTDTFKIKVPPKTVTKYVMGETEYIEVECDDDSLLVLLDSMGNELMTIDKDFVLAAPTSAKLISGFFSKKALQLNMLNTDGETYSLGYRVNYRRFKYQYVDNELRAEPRKGSKFSPPDSLGGVPFNHGIYLSPGYSIIDKKLTGSLDYLIQYGRFMGTVDTRVTIEQTPQLSLHAKIGVKLTK